MSIAPEALEELGPILHVVTREEYDQAVLAGVYEDQRVELLEGMVVEMGPEGPEHFWIGDELGELLVRSVGPGLKVRRTGPWIAGDLSEPEPDIAIVPRRNYYRQHPAVALLLIEVSKSSLRKDRIAKARIYARAAVPEYWVVDLVHEVTHVHTEPTPDGYASIVERPWTDVLDACGVAVRIADLIEEE